MTFEKLWPTLVIPGEFDAMDELDQARWRSVIRQAFEAGQAERDALKALLREFAAEVEGSDNGDGTMSDCSDALWAKIKAALAAKEGG